MKKILLGMLMITSLLFATSCTNDEEESATLLLSETELSFSSEAEEEDIAVTTNQENWDVIGSADWIEAVRDGSSLTVSVKPNTEPATRRGKVLVVAGNAHASIEIDQEGVKAFAIVNPEVVTFNAHEQQYVIDVNANSKKWKVSTDADWFTVEPKAFKGELLIKVQENEKREERTGKIILNVGSINKEIIVKQDGTLFFLLPFAKIGSGINPIRKFEEARGSRLIKQPDAENRFFWDFQTESPLFGKVRYGLDNGIYLLSMVYFNKEAFEAERENFIAYMQKVGFVEESTDIFYNENLELQAVVKTESREPHIFYKYMPKQTEDYPTFTEFPYGYKGWGLSRANIEKYESKNGGVFNDKQSNLDPAKPFEYLQYDVNSTDRTQPFERAYYVFKKKVGKYDLGLAQTGQHFKDMSVATFPGKDGQHYLTREFKALAKKEGFEFRGMNERGYYEFMNEKKGLGMLIIGVQYEGDAFPIVDIRLFPIKAEGNSVTDFSHYFDVASLQKDAL